MRLRNGTLRSIARAPSAAPKARQAVMVSAPLVGSSCKVQSIPEGGGGTTHAKAGLSHAPCKVTQPSSTDGKSVQPASSSTAGRLALPARSVRRRRENTNDADLWGLPQAQDQPSAALLQALQSHLQGPSVPVASLPRPQVVDLSESAGPVAPPSAAMPSSSVRADAVESLKAAGMDGLSARNEETKLASKWERGSFDYNTRLARLVSLARDVRTPPIASPQRAKRLHVESEVQEAPLHPRSEPSRKRCRESDADRIAAPVQQPAAQDVQKSVFNVSLRVVRSTPIDLDCG